MPRIYCCCTDQETGRYLAVDADDPRFQKAAYSKSDAVSDLVTAHPSRYRIELVDLDEVKEAVRTAAVVARQTGRFFENLMAVQDPAPSANSDSSPSGLREP